MRRQAPGAAQFSAAHRDGVGSDVEQPVLNEVIYSSTQENDEVSGALLFLAQRRHEIM